MTQPALDLSVLRKATATLERALNAHAANPTDEFIRDACIQRFEYCYDLATKMIRRHLQMTADDPSAITAMTAQERIRQAHSIGIIPNSWDTWWQYRDDRAATSHGYDENRAIALLERVPGFFSELSALTDNLSKIHET